MTLDPHDPVPSPDTPPARPRTPVPVRAWLAWVLILAVCGVAVLQHRWAPEAADEGDPIGQVLIQLQSKYLVGIRQFVPQPDSYYEQAKGLLNLGSVDQRQRFVVLAGELAGAEEAQRQLDALDRLIAAPPVGGPVELTGSQAEIQRILHELYPTGGDGPAQISEADRRALVADLGWLGELGLSQGAPQDTRSGVLGPARIVAIALVLAAFLAIGAGVVGFVGLILVVTFTFLGRVQSGLGPRRAYHVLYAETFGLWLVLFLGLQQLAGLAPTDRLQMAAVIVAFPASLAVLAWPVLRGVPWSAVRADVGLTLGARPAAEPWIGLGGYLMTLPLLAVGLALTLLLMGIQAGLEPEAPTFSPAGGPAHPIILHITGSDAILKLQILVLAAIVAPIVEETMFRGVLYRHLRDASRGLGLVLSIAAGTFVNCFLFAAIHPQGFVAVPVLMALACGMTLVREWRGTLVPSMVIHGLSNGLVMSLLLVVLNV